MAKSPVPKSPVSSEVALKSAPKPRGRPKAAAITPVVAPAPVKAAPIVKPPKAIAPKALATSPVAAKPATAPIMPPKTTTSTKGNMIMNDTVKQVQDAAQKMADDAKVHVETMVADVTAKAKEAAEKTKAMAEDAMTFHKENAEAVAESGKLMAEGVQHSAQYVADLGRKHFEEASVAMKTMAAAKSPSEFFSLQSDYIKTSYEAFVAEASKSSEATMKFFGEVFQPISSRAAVAAEKVKTATTVSL